MIIIVAITQQTEYQGLRCCTENTRSADVLGAGQGQHSRVLVGPLNAVEEVSVFRVSAIHCRILLKQSVCDQMVKCSIQCWELKSTLKIMYPKASSAITLVRWSFSFCLHACGDRGLILRGRFNLCLLISSDENICLCHSRGRGSLCQIQGFCWRYAITGGFGMYYKDAIGK